jgi:hypothetical protein
LKSAAFLLPLWVGLAFGQAQPVDVPTPHEYQAGKDVVWVPTPDTLVEKMLDMAKVTPADYVIDLGSGDGRTVIAAALRGARALGVEFNPDLVELSTRTAQKAGVAGRASFTKGDLFEADLSKATVITLFLLTDINLKLRPKLLGLRPGTRVVSNTFKMATGSRRKRRRSTPTKAARPRSAPRTCGSSPPTSPAFTRSPTASFACSRTSRSSPASCIATARPSPWRARCAART